MSQAADLIKMAAVLAALALGGCSQELYTETQDPVTLQFGDAVKSNVALQTVDPWPASAQNTNLSYKGRPMNSAIDRYYTGTILPPVANGTDSGLAGASKTAQAGASVTK
jgi:hypothetical protein